MSEPKLEMNLSVVWSERLSSIVVGAPWLSDASRAVLAAERDLWAWKRSDGPRWWAYLSDLVTGGRIRYGLHDTMRRLAEMTGVERRHPMLDDLDLIELILTIPPELSFDVRHTRPLLRDAVEGLVPDSIRLRTQKADFRFQIEESFAGPERDVIASLVLAPDARIRPFISQQVAADAVEKVGHLKFIPYQGGLLRMVTAECWLRAQAERDHERLCDAIAPSGSRVVLFSPLTVAPAVLDSLPA